MLKQLNVAVIAKICAEITPGPLYVKLACQQHLLKKDQRRGTWLVSAFNQVANKLPAQS